MPRLIRILFVCHGNICRSPMAEYVMKDIVRRRGLEERFVIDSAATSDEEIGNPVHPGTRRVLEENNIPCGNHVARRITADDATKWDLIVVMDGANAKNARCKLGSKANIYKLLEFAGEYRSVADPWYTGDFETTFDDVYAGCQGLLGYLGF